MSEARLTTITIGSSPAERTIAVRVREGKSPSSGPGLFWLGGFKSDMKGTKAEALDRWADSAARACVRFDYSGHGESGGDFEAGTIGRWLEESLAVYARFADGPQIVVGSSMGGWLALLLARALSGRKDTPPIAGMVLIAPAVDFTEELMWKQFSDTTKREIEQNGAWLRPSAYGERALSNHARADRGWPQTSDAGWPDRNPLPRAYFARAYRIRTYRGGMPSSWCRVFPVTTLC